ncbi:restriction endonuclease subunit S [Lactococcus petauri]|uniref:restriction endonuclease subunit S n=1 Tax=Lactococcus petauri TaxID=1940789 RepID=UPI00385446A0
MAKIDNSVKKKVPELRFKGFTDDWEERKLGELSQKISVGIATSSSKHFSSQDQGVPFIKNQDIKENRINTKNLEYISKEFDNKNKNKRVRQGDIITARTGYPGLSAVVPKELEGAQTFTTLITRPISEMILSEYISIFINSPYGMKQISGMEAGGAQKNVNAGILQNLLIPLPSLDEQKQISNFILKLDNTITLHQRKLDLLKEQKKGYLQKMFPKNGSKIPELRFAGFADDWEERKLGNLSQDTIGGGTPKTSVTEYWNGEIPWIQSSDLANDKLYGVLPKKFITEDAVKNSATKLIPANSIAIVTRVGVGKLAFMPYEFASSQDFLSLSNLQVDCNFGMYSIYKMLQRELNNIQGTSIKGITKADLLDKETFVPIKVEEQQKIGSFFKQLDDIIDLHQRRLDLLKEQKKGFLQKMFI